MHLHGPGPEFGDVATHDRLREPAGDASTAVDIPACTRSPETHCPIAIEQLYEVGHSQSDEAGPRCLDWTATADTEDSA